MAAWAARVVREPRSIIPGLRNLTRAGKLQVVGNQEELNPTLTSLLGWSLGEARRARFPFLPALLPAPRDTAIEALVPRGRGSIVERAKAERD